MRMRAVFISATGTVSISWISDANAGATAPIEMNFYGGFKKELIAPGFAS
jgi:hypothetical protein